MGGVSKFYVPIRKVLIETTLVIFHFPETVQMFSNPTPTTQSSLNLQLHQRAREKTEEKLPHHWGGTRKFWTLLSPSNTRKKDKNLRFTQGGRERKPDHKSFRDFSLLASDPAS